MSAIEFKPGDIVRVRAARRRDVTFRVSEIIGEVVVAKNERGGECRYVATAFEHVVEHDAERAIEPVVERVIERVAEPVIPELQTKPPTFDTDLVRARKNSTAVVPYPGEEIDGLIRRFKKATQKAGVLVDARKHEHFTGKSERRRKKSKAARTRRGE